MFSSDFIEGALARFRVALLESASSQERLEELVTLFAALDKTQKLLEPKKKELREVLLAAAAAQGSPLANGGSVLTVGDDTVQRVRRQASAPDEQLLKALLETHGIDLHECFDEVKTLQLNPSKLKFLVEVGRLKEEEVEALRSETFALTVVPGPALQQRLDAACGESPPSKKPRHR